MTIAKLELLKETINTLDDHIDMTSFVYDVCMCGLKIRKLELEIELGVKPSHTQSIVNKYVKDVLNYEHDSEFWIADEEYNGAWGGTIIELLFDSQEKRIVNKPESICIRRQELYNDNNGAFDVYTFFNDETDEIAYERDCDQRPFSSKVYRYKSLIKRVELIESNY
tara:strand:+ start:430 stop:930 length:501 start_codon:yes stop_codon:yes gene_type:complete